MSRKSTFFAGSFNPFTVGHLSVVERALSLFDRVVIGIGVNAEKGVTPDAEKQAAMLSHYFRNKPQVEVCVYTGLTADEAKKHKCDCLLRAVRNVTDFEYERNLADVNRNIFGMETFILYTEPQYAYVSSSLVRELQRYGVDTSRFLLDYD